MNQQEMNLNNQFDLVNPELCNEQDDLLRQLTENTFDVDTFFSDFQAADIKVSTNYIEILKDLTKIIFSSCFRRKIIMTFKWSLVTKIKVL